MPFRRAQTRWGLVLLPVLLMLAGCPFSPKKGGGGVDPPVSKYLPLTSISNVLFNLKLSYNEKNITEYTKLLHSSYTYVFDPQDVGSGHGIPESWGMADEIVSATNLFTNQPNQDGYRCETILLKFDIGPERPSTYFPDTWRMVTISAIQLEVDTRHKDNGDQLLYQALGDKADLHFVQVDETDPASGLKLWKIIQWEDKPVRALAAKTQ